MGKPDAVIEMPMDFPVPAEGTVDYTYFVVPTGFTEDKWVENVEVRAGNSKVVHHVVVEVRPPGVVNIHLTDAKYGEPFVPEHRTKVHKPDTGQGALEVGTLEVAGVYVPGGVPYYLRQPGQARLIPAGSDLASSRCTTPPTGSRPDRPQPHWASCSPNSRRHGARGEYPRHQPATSRTFRPAPPTTRCRR